VSSTVAATDAIRRIPDPGEPVPALARPTVALFAGCWALWLTSTGLALSGAWWWGVSVVLNAIACFAIFTVSHEASHHTLSTSPTVNLWFGRFSNVLFAPHAGFKTWRFIHMQHHRFTNEEDGRDPDHFTHRGPAWSAPLRWATVDLYYMVFYVPKLRSRPRAEQAELAVTWAVVGGAIVAAVATGHLAAVLVLYLLPIRIAVTVLGWSFDYLPHHGLHETRDKYQATRNRIGLERLLNPLMLYQNYHLVHHLHPRIPFYKYVEVWRRKEREHLANGPALTDVRGRELTVEEYRRLRELADH
jgi:fatty acid desaturase